MASEAYIRHHKEVVVDSVIARRGFLSSLHAISERDYPRKNYFGNTDIPAIDIDSYETSRTGQNKKTADAAIGIADEFRNRILRKRFLLVELRMDYTNIENLSVSDLCDKESHSRHLLRECDEETSIDSGFCLVFRRDFESQAVNWLNRQQKANAKIAEWLCFSPETFCNFINYNTDFPFIPLETTISMSVQFEKACKSNDINKLSDVWDCLHSYLTQCSYKYLLDECRWLSEKIADTIDDKDSIFSHIDAEKHDSEEYEILAEILKEEITSTIARFI